MCRTWPSPVASGACFRAHRRGSGARSGPVPPAGRPVPRRGIRPVVAPQQGPGKAVVRRTFPGRGARVPLLRLSVYRFRGRALEQDHHHLMFGERVPDPEVSPAHAANVRSARGRQEHRGVTGSGKARILREQANRAAHVLRDRTPGRSSVPLQGGTERSQSTERYRPAHAFSSCSRKSAPSSGAASAQSSSASSGVMPISVLTPRAYSSGRCLPTVGIAP